MKTIKKKIWSEYFDDIASGKKKYELRLADFYVEEGDVLVLEEWDQKTKKYTGRTKERKITHVGEKWQLEDLLKYWTKEEIKEHKLQILSLE